MITVQSTFHLAPETKDEALNLMRDMVKLCHKEQGCLNYEYFEGLTDTNQIVLLQEWESADCLQGHYQTAHMENFLGKLSKYLQSEVVTRSYASEEKPAAPQISDESPNPEQTIH